MAKTQGDLVREHDNAIATILERVSSIRADMNRLEASILENTRSCYRFETQVGRVEERITELKRMSEEADRRRWMLVIAVVGSILSLVVNVILTLIRK